MKTVGSFATVFFGLVLNIGAQTWSTKTPAPTPSYSSVGGVINGKLYSIGYDSSAHAILQVYDPATDSWAVKTPMPTNQIYSGVGVINGILYAAGGCINANCVSVSNGLEAYDPGTNNWTHLADTMPTGTYSSAATVMSGKLYLIGGTINNSGSKSPLMQIYDPSTHAWTAKYSPATARQGLTANVIDGKIYVVGGVTGSSTGETDVYDPVTDTWSLKTPMPTPRWWIASGVLNGELYIVGGQGDSPPYALSTVEKYNPITNAWSTLASLPAAQAAPASWVYNNHLYVEGGHDANGAHLKTLQVYNIQPPPTPVLSSPSNFSQNVSMSVHLAWNPSSTADTYHLQVSTDSTFTTLTMDDSTLTDPSRNLVSLNNNTVHYWRVSARNSGGTSAWSQTWNFTTVPAIPATPVPTVPAQNAVNIPISPSLTWNAASRAATYQLQVSTDSIFASPFFNDSTITILSRIVGPLNEHTRYYWRVNARNAGGTSAWSGTMRFTTTLAAPNLISPAQNAVNVPVSTYLTWSMVPSATDYRVQLSTNASFTGPLLVDNSNFATSQSIGPLSLNTTYYWRVYAQNSSGAGPWSSQQFSTGATVALLSDARIVPSLRLEGGNVLRFGIDHATRVTLRIFDSQGRMIATLLDEDREAGYYSQPIPALKVSGSRFILDFRADGFHRVIPL